MNEIYLGNNYKNFHIRLLKSFSVYFYFLSLVSIGFFILKGYSNGLIISYLVCIIISLIYCFSINKQILYGVVLNKDAKTILIKKLIFNRVHDNLIFPINDIEIIIHRNYSFRYEVWSIYFFKKRKLLLKQNSLNGWNKKLFEEILSKSKV
jgi:hypothetical protein